MQTRDEERSPAAGASAAEPELLFQTIDDISSLALDAVVPSALYGLDQFGDLGTSDLLQWTSSIYELNAWKCICSFLKFKVGIRDQTSCPVAFRWIALPVVEVDGRSPHSLFRVSQSDLRPVCWGESRKGSQQVYLRSSTSTRKLWPPSPRLRLHVCESYPKISSYPLHYMNKKHHPIEPDPRKSLQCKAWLQIKFQNR